LQRVDRAMEARRRNAQRYQAILDRHDCGRLIPPELDGVRLIRFPLVVANRERFIRDFVRVGIEVGRWFDQPVTCGGGDVRRYGYESGSCPTAEHVTAHVVNLDRYLKEHPEERDFVAAHLE
jgi:dTDP-4-amino-4,6-dideoxygalactose transaminase